MTISVELSDAWVTVFPSAAIGLLAMTPVKNSTPGVALQARLSSIEATVRARHAGQSRRDL